MATIFTEKVRHPSTNNWIPLFRVQENDNNKYELQFFDDTKNNFTSLNNMLTNRQNIIPDTSGLYSIGDSTHCYTDLHLTNTLYLGGRDIKTLEKVWYGTCNSTGIVCSVECPNFILNTGAMIVVQMTANNSDTSLTKYLNVANTGSKSILWRRSNTQDNQLCWTAGDYLTFIYNGSRWVYMYTNRRPEDYMIDMGKRNLSPDDTDYFIWEKWHSGKITISGQQPVNLSNITWSQWGSLYYYIYQGLSIDTTLLSSLNLINPPQIFVSWVGTGHDAWCGISKLNISGTQTIDTTKQLPYITIYRGSTSNNLEGWIYYQLIGQTDLTQS